MRFSGVDGAVLEGYRGKMAELIDYAQLPFHDRLALVLAIELVVGPGYAFIHLQEAARLHMCLLGYDRF